MQAQPVVSEVPLVGDGTAANKGAKALGSKTQAPAGPGREKAYSLTHC